MSKQKIPAIPVPTTDPRSLQNSLLSMKEGVEILAGVRRGTTTAVTWEDLIRLGLASEADMPKR